MTKIANDLNNNPWYQMEIGQNFLKTKVFINGNQIQE